MNRDDLLDILRRVERGDLSPDSALDILRDLPGRRLAEGLHLDVHRAVRTGHGEVILAAGKSDTQLEAAVDGLRRTGQPVLATRVAEPQGAQLLERFPDGEFWPRPGLFSLGRPLALAEPWPDNGEVMVVSAGASDLPVALEALGCCRFFGLSAGLAPDVGVAGLHRIEPYAEALRRARLLIVAAGMEGALPSVLGGLFGRPILAVPTSVGYGASFGGLAALLAMLNGCAPGVAVVNIDNGFGAAAMAAKLLAPDRA